MQSFAVGRNMARFSLSSLCALPSSSLPNLEKSLDVAQISLFIRTWKGSFGQYTLHWITQGLSVLALNQGCCCRSLLTAQIQHKIHFTDVFVSDLTQAWAPAAVWYHADSASINTCECDLWCLLWMGSAVPSLVYVVYKGLISEKRRKVGNQSFVIEGFCSRAL